MVKAVKGKHATTVMVLRSGRKLMGFAFKVIAKAAVSVSAA